ncbi:MAG: cytochrome c biogenesis protein ResB [Elusimicrobia bacterium]|nr:cytochrome c biogenesis protein ResB [Elusimicrobiota bacterium]
MKRIEPKKLLASLSSIWFTIACLSLFIVLVLACTLAQAKLGIYESVKIYIRSFFLYADVGPVRIPVFPGGALVGLALLLNLALAQFSRLEMSRRKLGVWLAHLGLVVLFLGEFSTGLFQIETQMFLDEGVATAHSEDLRELELVVVDFGEPDSDVVYALRQRALIAGRPLKHPDLPFSVEVQSFQMRSQGDSEYPVATAEIKVSGSEGDRPLTLSSQENGQTLNYASRAFMLTLRPRRHYLPFQLTLKKFNRKMYPGTDIPSHFSSQIRLADPARNDFRDVLISMNDPLRYGGQAFYQASFGKDDKMSVLQVVRNPGWLMPYISCALVLLGMIIHFAVKLRPALKEPA